MVLVPSHPAKTGAAADHRSRKWHGWSFATPPRQPHRERKTSWVEYVRSNPNSSNTPASSTPNWKQAFHCAWHTLDSGPAATARADSSGVPGNSNSTSYPTTIATRRPCLKLLPRAALFVGTTWMGTHSATSSSFTNINASINGKHRASFPTLKTPTRTCTHMLCLNMASQAAESPMTFATPSWRETRPVYAVDRQTIQQWITFSHFRWEELSL